MRAYITKYALSSGVFLVETDRHETESGGVYWKPKGGYTMSAYGKEWHKTPEAALADAERRRLAKIASLKKQIAKLEKMTFTIPDEVSNA